ncbi:MAG: serine hydrolase [Erythrobacter sp.]
MLLRVLFIIALSTPFSLAPIPAFAQSQQVNIAIIEERSGDVLKLFSQEIDPEEVFASSFLVAVPAASFSALSAQISTQVGAPVSVENIQQFGPFKASFDLVFERGIGRIEMDLEPAQPHRITGLLIRQIDPIDDSFTKIATELRALPGDVSAYFGPLVEGSPALAINTDDQLAIGSTFKLYVLAALARDVADGRRQWDDLTTLTQRSFPSGMMQDWPPDAPVTLQTLASLMISISDNTATDQVMHELGREPITQTLEQSGHSNLAMAQPFLTTREMFALKGGPAETLGAYRRPSTLAQRAEFLDQLDTSALSAAQIEAAFSGNPVALDVEWFASANDLRRLIIYMRDHADPLAFDILGINPSLPQNLRSKWRYAGYKGGSEPGVLNLTWVLANHAGDPYFLTLSWNNPDAPLEPGALEALAHRILALPLPPES